MEVLFGAVAWNYEGTFGSINGRTNFVFGVMWGLLGLIWVRTVLPFFKRAFEAVDVETTAMKIVGVVLRSSRRRCGVHARRGGQAKRAHGGHRGHNPRAGVFRRVFSRRVDEGTLPYDGVRLSAVNARRSERRERPNDAGDAARSARIRRVPASWPACCRAG